MIALPLKLPNSMTPNLTATLILVPPLLYMSLTEEENQAVSVKNEIDPSIVLSTPANFRTGFKSQWLSFKSLVLAKWARL